DHVGEDHRARDRGRAHPPGATTTLPDAEDADTTQSSPRSQSHRVEPPSDEILSLGRTWGGSSTVTEPDIERTLTSPSPLAPTDTMPLTVRMRTAPSTSSARTVLDTVPTSSWPASPTMTSPLAVWARQAPPQRSTSTSPDAVRTSRDATSSTVMSPLAVVTRQRPRRPRSSTSPDGLPTMTSVSSGQRTSASGEPFGRRVTRPSAPGETWDSWLTPEP